MRISSTSAWTRHIVHGLVASTATILLTVLMLALHARASASGIVFLVLIVWFASVTGPALSLFLALLSALLFDFFFLEPLYSINISGFQDWLAMLSYVAACVVVSRVAERARRQTLNAEMRRADVERLYALSLEMMLHEDAQRLVHDIPRLVEKNFALGSVLLYVKEDDQFYAASQPALTPEDSKNLHQLLRTSCSAAESQAEASTVSPVQSPEGYVSTSLAFGMNTIGTLAWKPATLSREVATSVASQVAVAITRAHAIESSARLEAARNTDRLRASLIDSLTHELRTPLTAIRAAVTTLASTDNRQALDEEVRAEFVSIIDEESSRLDALIGEAMQMAEIDANAIQVAPEQVRLRTLFEQAIEQSQPLLRSHRVSIAVEEPDDPVWLDPRLLSRVLRHLLENAARYTPPGTRITLRSHHLAAGIELSVEDNGPGIDPIDLPHIFEKFYRGRHSQSKVKGSGMGLSIARAILTAHGGYLMADSIPGKGTTFRITLPTIDKGSAQQSFRSIEE